jgi:hypothetical protein
VCGPLTVSLQLAGIVRADVEPVTVTLSSSSPGATFATSSDGPWTSALAVEIPTGSTDAVFYYRDTVAGTPAIGAAASGRTTAQQIETVTPGPLARIDISTQTLTLRRGMTYPFSASGSDVYGNAVAIWPHWSATTGKLSKLDGTTTTYKGRQGRHGDDHRVVGRRHGQRPRDGRLTRLHRRARTLAPAARTAAESVALSYAP